MECDKQKTRTVKQKFHSVPHLPPERMASSTSKRTVQVSKNLSWLLRHGGPKGTLEKQN